MIDRLVPRWYQHAGIKRFGWRTWYVQSPRIWKAGLHAEIYALNGFNLGIWFFTDPEDDQRVLVFGFGLLEIRLTRVRFITKRQARGLQDEFARRHGAELADEAEQFLREHT